MKSIISKFSFRDLCSIFERLGLTYLEQNAREHRPPRYAKPLCQSTVCHTSTVKFRYTIDWFPGESVASGISPGSDDPSAIPRKDLKVRSTSYTADTRTPAVNRSG